MTGRVLLGTSSFSDPAWVGPFYPPGTAKARFLEHYAKRLGTVEIDATYYATPSPATVDGWRRRTPEGFLLAAKVPREIVHGGTGPRPDRRVVLVPEVVGPAMEGFLDVITRLGERLGPLLLQFPWFGEDVFPDRREFLDRLDAFLERWPREVDVAVELRNGPWLDATLGDLLRRHGAGLALSEMARMPHPADVAARLDVVTQERFAYLRLIGDRKATEALTTRFDRTVIDQSASLDRWAPLIRELQQRVPRVLVFANNHYAGHAPATLRELARRLDIDLPGPPGTPSLFPDLDGG